MTKRSILRALGRLRCAALPALSLGLSLGLAAASSAQQVTSERFIPPELAQEVLLLINDPGTLQLVGDAVVPSDRTLDGPVALVAGRLAVNGTVRGDVIVFNGDLDLGPEARVQGDVLVVGGRLVQEAGAEIAGLATVYRRGYPIVRQEGAWVAQGDLRRDQPSLSLGRSRFTVRSGRGYNRAEGLPILFGPTIRTPGEHPLRLDAQAIFRTETFSTDNLGYSIRLEQSFGGPARPRLGLHAYSQVEVLEDRDVSDLESSLSTFFLHRDLRDHFQNTGWSAYVDMQRRDLPVSARLSFHRDDHFALRAGDPLTVFRRDEAWRAQPLVAEGELSTLRLEVTLDDRNNPDDPTDGWYVQGSLRRGLSGDITVPGYGLTPLAPSIMGPRFDASELAVGSLDVRRYARVDPTSDLRLRLRLGGSLNGKSLPPQYQQTLGGVGTLPGFDRFALDCAARQSTVFVADDGGRVQPTYPAYGCDRTVLFQAQYRQELDFRLTLPGGDGEWSERRWWPDVDLTVAWSAFFNAGRGWSFSPGGEDSRTLADAGLGLLIGDLGGYVAYPFEGDEREVSFILRLQHRF